MTKCFKGLLCCLCGYSGSKIKYLKCKLCDTIDVNGVRGTEPYLFVYLV